MEKSFPKKTPDPDSSDSRHLLLRRAALAPLCLCLVASLHAVRVVACGQTQWKGGGFGMFSTVDSETARFVRAFAITDDGELPLAIPNALDKSVAELRAAPTKAKAEFIAGRLAAVRWRRPDEQMIRDAQRFTAAANTEINLPQPRVGLFRSLEAISGAEISEASDHRLPVRSVRVECWRLRLVCDTRDPTEDAACNATLHSELLRQATAEVTP